MNDRPDHQIPANNMVEVNFTSTAVYRIRFWIRFWMCSLLHLTGASRKFPHSGQAAISGGFATVRRSLAGTRIRAYVVIPMMPDYMASRGILKCGLIPVIILCTVMANCVSAMIGGISSMLTARLFSGWVIPGGSAWPND